MKFRVKTYFGEKRVVKNRSQYFLAYFFNLLYRSVIPLGLFYVIIKWETPDDITRIIMGLVLLFFVLYQFTWSVE